MQSSEVVTGRITKLSVEITTEAYPNNHFKAIPAIFEHFGKSNSIVIFNSRCRGYLTRAEVGGSK